MRDIEKLDINKVRPNGRYVDLERTLIIDLTDEDIMALRRLYNDDSIAYLRNSNPVVTKNEVNPKPQYKLCRTHDKRKHRGLSFAFKRVVIGGVTILMAIGFYNVLKGKSPSPINDEVSIETYYQGENENNNDIVLSDLVYRTDTVYSNDLMQFRKDIVFKYCNIYCVNFDVVYGKLCQLTDNFNSDDYLNKLTIPGVTCKGEQVYASCEEELLLYFVRSVKQVPERFGIEENSLYVTNRYKSDDNYVKQIGYYSKLLGVDPSLIYAIVQTETGWKSDLFLNSNNPAGLRASDGWWEFDTKEEGFIELILEVIKYQKMGAHTIEEIGNIHAPVSDGNANWVPVVTEIYNSIKPTENELFGFEDAEMSLKG